MRRRGPMPTQLEKAMEKAVKATRGLIQNVNNSLARERSTPLGDEPMLAFHRPQLGQLLLVGLELSTYQACLNTLLKVHGPKDERREVSRRKVERILQAAILRTILPLRPRPTRATFERRLADQLRTLRRELTQEPVAWTFIVEVHGLASRGLPVTFGGVTFEHGDGELGRRAGARLAPASEADGVRQDHAAATRAGLEAHFLGEAIAIVRVSAVDEKAVELIGEARVARAVQALNFFMSFDADAPVLRRAYLAPAGKRTRFVWVAQAEASHDVHWGHRGAESTRALALDLSSDRAAKLGVHRASALLASGNRSDFEDRIVTALGWAGRACVADERDQSFLFYAIALEALLLKPLARAGVSERLKRRAAHVGGLRADTKREVFGLMAGLYRLRSELVHAGDSTLITADDLASVRAVVARALTRVLTDERFTSMRTAREFDAWCDAQPAVV